MIAPAASSARTRKSASSLSVMSSIRIVCPAPGRAKVRPLLGCLAYVATGHAAKSGIHLQRIGVGRHRRYGPVMRPHTVFKGWRLAVLAATTLAILGLVPPLRAVALETCDGGQATIV